MVAMRLQLMVEAQKTQVGQGSGGEGKGRRGREMGFRGSVGRLLSVQLMVEVPCCRWMVRGKGSGKEE